MRELTQRKQEGDRVSSGLALGAVLQRLLDTPLHVGHADVVGMAAVGAAVVLAVTAATLPLLRRTVRPEGLRWEEPSSIDHGARAS